MKKIILCITACVLILSFAGCTANTARTLSSPVFSDEENTPDVSANTSDSIESSVEPEDASIGTENVATEAEESPQPGTDNQSGKTSQTAKSKPDGKGVLQFTVVLHLEGWEDGKSKERFQKHADLLREYASLFEKYGAKMTLESKEIIDGCIKWGDNVLLEMQKRGHAVGIHADAGGEKKATVKNIADKLKEMKAKLKSLGIDANFASGVASKADWVKACKDAGMDAVTCMVCYGLWSLDPALRPAWFKPYANPSEGHAPYPAKITNRIHPWFAKSGSNWIKHSKDGGLIIIPSGLSLTNAAEEIKGSQKAGKTEFTQEDIEAWKNALPKVLAATDSSKVNTFYAVWSFGQKVDLKLLEDWLKMVKTYVDEGRIQWTVIPDMISAFQSNH